MANLRKQEDITKLWIKVAVGVVLLFVAPPLGLIVLVVFAKPFFESLKTKGILQTNVEGKSSINWNRAQQSGREAARETTRLFKEHISEGDIMDERLPRRHSHTPHTYSHDSCATDRRLEQLKGLRSAGLLTEQEFQQRKAKLFARRS